MSITLYDYQKHGVDCISRNYASGIRRQLFQLPTGGGKTIVFCAMTKRYLSSFDLPVLILVHRDELLRQTRKSLFNHFGIHSEPITAKTKHLRKSKVYVGMVETVYNRLKKHPLYFGKIGMLIVDECHIGNFNKVYEFFPNSLIVGFSATPISSKKKFPLNGFFDEIVSTIQISELIKRKKLAPNITRAVKSGIERKDLKIKGGEFDKGFMSSEFSKSRNLNNTLETYRKYATGKKTIIFNCTVEHSLNVTALFNENGFKTRHLDGKTPGGKRTEILNWFKNTPDAILCNIGVLTTGFDEPSIERVIINRATTSMPLWLQMTGRGGRICPGKTGFEILDLGGNAATHGDWSYDRDWIDIFFNPPKPSKGGGVAPIKSCDECEALIPAQARVCEYCGTVHERQITYDAIALDFELVVNNINVHEELSITQKYNMKEWRTFFAILDKTIAKLPAGLEHKEYEKAYLVFQDKVHEWFKIRKKSFTKPLKEFSRKQFFKKIPQTQAI